MLQENTKLESGLKMIQGVGTVTYVCEDGTFAALGHGISDNETGKVLDIKDGMIYRTRILFIVPGKNGEPGELLWYY